MTSETVTEEVKDEVVEDTEAQEEVQEQDVEEQIESTEEKKEESVPVSAVMAERKKRQEAEQRAQWLEQQMMQAKPQQQNQKEVNPNDLLTVGDQAKTLNEWKRSILEESYVEYNPDILERVKTELPEILTNPRHQWLAESIEQAPNRLQRAAQVLEMFKPKRQAAPAPNRENTPKSPQSVSKTNKLSLADRIMSMSDQELEEWRMGQKKKTR